MNSTLRHPRRLLGGPLRNNLVLRHLRRGSRAKRQKRRWPWVTLWGLGVAASIAGLVGLAHLHAAPPDAKGPFPDAALATLAKTGVAVFAVCGILVFMVWCIRRISLEFLSWWPGRILVHTFAADEELPAVELERLTAGFRDRLGQSHLQSPAATPAPAEQGAFLDVLAGGKFDPQDPLSSLVTLLRAASPSHAYEVRGALVTGEGPRSKGVTVHVVRLPGKGAGGHTVWDTTWEGAMRQAADHAAASILPRTRVCRSPWARWPRYYLPPSLFEAYERAAELEHERRYDEALHLYLKAVAADPKNLALRLQLGFLQEKLALYLDALDTYQSILQIAGAETVADDFGDGRGQLRKPGRPAARWERGRAQRVTRYRRAVLSGRRPAGPPVGKVGSEQLQDPARQGAVPASGTPRTGARAAVHSSARLTPSSRAKEIFDGAPTTMPNPTRCKEALEKPARAGKQGTSDELEQLFLLASLHELNDLKSRIPRYPIRRTSLTRATVQVSRLVVEARLRWTANGGSCGTDGSWKKFHRRHRRPISRDSRRADEFDRWQEHYNAACIYALPLLAADNPPPEAAAKTLTGLAVQRLEAAVEKADSSYIASRRDWLVERGSRSSRTARPAALQTLRGCLPSLARPSAMPSPERSQVGGLALFARFAPDHRPSAGRTNGSGDERP